MTTPRTITETLDAAAAAVSSQRAATAAVLNAAAIAGLSAGTTGPALPPAVTDAPRTADGGGGG